MLSCPVSDRVEFRPVPPLQNLRPRSSELARHIAGSATKAFRQAALVGKRRTACHSLAAVWHWELVCENGLKSTAQPLSLYRCCRTLQVQGEQAAGRAHPVPVILVGCTAAQTNLVMAAIVVEPWPGKTVRATSSEDPLQESHLRAPLLGNAPQPLRADGDSSFGQTRSFRGVLPSVKG